MTTEDRQELNFKTFHSAHLASISSLYDASSEMATERTRARSFALASLLEAVCWTSLGARLGYFPRRVPPLVAREQDVRVFLRDWGHLFDWSWLDYINQVTVNYIIPPEVNFGDNLDLESASDAFSTCVRRFVTFTQGPAASAAIAILNFNSWKDVELSLARHRQLEDLSDALALETGIDATSGIVITSSVYVGFGEMIGFLENFREAHELGRGDQSAGAVFQKVAQLMTWRFHFFQKRPEHRDKFVDRYLDSLELTDSELRRRFRAHIDRVSGFWAGMQGPTRTVEA